MGSVLEVRLGSPEFVDPDRFRILRVGFEEIFSGEFEVSAEAADLWVDMLFVPEEDVG